jgi:hypothetical protein
MNTNDVSNARKLLNEMYEVLQNEAKKGFETPNEQSINYDNQIAILRVIRLLNKELLKQSEQLRIGVLPAVRPFTYDWWFAVGKRAFELRAYNGYMEEVSEYCMHRCFDCQLNGR